MRQKWSLLAIRLDTMIGVKQTLHIVTNTSSPPWSNSLQRHAVGMLLCRKSWEVEGKINAAKYLELLGDNLQGTSSLQKNCDSKEDLLPSKTMTPSTKLKIHKNSLRAQKGLFFHNLHPTLKVCRKKLLWCPHILYIFIYILTPFGLLHWICISLQKTVNTFKSPPALHIFIKATSSSVSCPTTGCCSYKGSMYHSIALL